VFEFYEVFRKQAHLYSYFSHSFGDRLLLGNIFPINSFPSNERFLFETVKFQMNRGLVDEICGAPFMEQVPKKFPEKWNQKKYEEKVVEFT